MGQAWGKPTRISDIWWFPKIGIPPVIIHFRLGFYAIGVPPWPWKPPYDGEVNTGYFAGYFMEDHRKI